MTTVLVIVGLAIGFGSQLVWVLFFRKPAPPIRCKHPEGHDGECEPAVPAARVVRGRARSDR